jgi:flagellar assembly factor FliW
MNLHDFLRNYEANIMSNANNMFKQQFIIHTDEVSSIMSVTENLY